MSNIPTIPVKRYCEAYPNDTYCTEGPTDMTIIEYLINYPNTITWLVIFFVTFLTVQRLFVQSNLIKKFIGKTILVIAAMSAFIIFTDWIFGAQFVLFYILHISKMAVLTAVLSGALLGLLVYYVFALVINEIKLLFKRPIRTQRSGKSDIREVAASLPKPFNKSPVSFYRKGKFFLGLDEKHKPMYMKHEDYVYVHKELIGTTGCRKGVQIQNMVYQDCINDDVPVMFMPKLDLMTRKAIVHIGRETKRPVIFLNLMGNAPQVNLFKGKSVLQVEELLESAFSLSDRGTDADYYRLKDRKSAKIFAKYVVNKKERLSEVVAAFVLEYESLLKDSPKFKEDLIELSNLSCVNADHNGLSIEQLLDTQNIVYIEGSMRYSVAIKAQKLLLLSVMQACETRCDKATNFVAIYLDEFKVLLSRPSLGALSALRSSRSHLTIAHQSLGDLKDCGADLNAEAVVAAINENCSLKWAYKVHDPDTAHWLARSTGTILIDEETRKFSVNKAMIETDEHQRLLKQTDGTLIDSNVFLMLPKGGAIIIGKDLAKFTSVTPIKLAPSLPDLVPTIVTKDFKSDDYEDLSGGLIDVD